MLFIVAVAVAVAVAVVVGVVIISMFFSHHLLLSCSTRKSFWVVFNPFRAPKPLPILNSSKIVPQKGFQLWRG